MHRELWAIVVMVMVDSGVVSTVLSVDLLTDVLVLVHLMQGIPIPMVLTVVTVVTVDTVLVIVVIEALTGTVVMDGVQAMLTCKMS
jgi:hypothetical protein